MISGAIMGAGAAKRVSAVRWGVAGNIVTAWVLTLPASAAVGAFTYGLVWVLGANGPLIVGVGLLALVAVSFARRAASQRRAATVRRMIAALLEAVAIAVVAGVGVTTLFSVVVLAGARSIEARRNGHARPDRALVHGLRRRPRRVRGGGRARRPGHAARSRPERPHHVCRRARPPRSGPAGRA